MYWDVVDVQPLENRTLRVTFSDGVCGTVRIDRAYCTGVFSPLLDEDLIKQATVQYGAVTWPNGLDLAPDTMYMQIRQSPASHYDVGYRQQ